MAHNNFELAAIYMQSLEFTIGLPYVCLVYQTFLSTLHTMSTWEQSHTHCKPRSENSFERQLINLQHLL